jgi:hypothetical protein
MVANTPVLNPQTSKWQQQKQLKDCVLVLVDLFQLVETLIVVLL